MSFMNKLAALDGGWSQVGAFGGACFRATCHVMGADWYCKPYRRYYCESCAAEINRERARKGETPSCFKHVWYREARRA